jgi:hypothetical protein
MSDYFLSFSTIVWNADNGRNIANYYRLEMAFLFEALATEENQ